MKTKLILLLLIAAITLASCKTSKQGCEGATYQGPKFKPSKSKFKWY